MGRSVSTPSNAKVIAFHYPDFNNDENDSDIENEFEWEYIKVDFVETCKAEWPSLWEDDQWLGREDHVLLANRLAMFGISEYCGVVAYWVAPKEHNGDYDITGIAEHWCDQIEAKFVSLFGNVKRIGAMSNGEAVYARL